MAFPYNISWRTHLGENCHSKKHVVFFFHILIFDQLIFLAYLSHFAVISQNIVLLNIEKTKQELLFAPRSQGTLRLRLRPSVVRALPANILGIRFLSRLPRTPILRTLRLRQSSSLTIQITPVLLTHSQNGTFIISVLRLGEGLCCAALE